MDPRRTSESSKSITYQKQSPVSLAHSQIPQPLYKKLMTDTAMVVAGSDPAVLARFQEPPSLFVFMSITLVLVVIGWILTAVANWAEITNNWPKYKCMPNVMPFAKFYGYDLNETMSFCIGEAVKEHSPGVITPIYTGINKVMNTVDGVYDQAKSISGGVKKLLSGFEKFLMQFANSFRLIGTRIRISLVKIRDIFDRIYGMFTSFALAGVSAITFGSNLMCNPIVTFIGTIAGVDVCCFARDTIVELENGMRISIQRVRLGDVLRDGGIVTSTFEFDGSRTDMVRIHGVHVSGNHCLQHEGRFVEALNHPDAILAEKVDRLYCLSTTTNKIAVVYRRFYGTNVRQMHEGYLTFTDYEESCEPAVVREAQAAAEAVLNPRKQGFTYVANFSLGIDPTAYLALDSHEKRFGDVKIGDRLPCSSTIVGIVHETCDHCVRSPSGIIMSAAQLVRVDGSWQRAVSVFAPVAGSHVLIQVITDSNRGFQVRKGAEFLFVRDYMEVHSTAVQNPYDKAILSCKT